MGYLFLGLLFGGLLLYLLSANQQSKQAEVGRLVFFAAAIGFLVALAPSAVRLLQGG